MICILNDGTNSIYGLIKHDALQMFEE